MKLLACFYSHIFQKLPTPFYYHGQQHLLQLSSEIENFQIKMNNNFRKILIVGNGGSGKSTLALFITSLLKNPVLHLDEIYWIDGWKKHATSI